MTRYFRAGIAAATALAALSGCTATSGAADLLRADVAARTVPVGDASALPEVVDATRRLGTVLLGAAKDQNTVVSPSSLAVALSMLTEGARGTSLTELEAALGATGENRRDAFAALRGALLALDGDPRAATGDELPERPIVHLAGQVVINNGFTVNDDFLAALADVYDAGIQHADLASEEGKKLLDAWTDRHTGGLIPESAITPTPDLRLVFQDAILLAARWQTPFLAADTYPRVFTLPDGATVDVDMMSALKTPFAYAEVSGWQAARLPYQEALHADVVLPPAGTDPGAVTPEILAALDHALDQATPAPLDLAMPVLDLQSELNLLDLFPALGVGSVRCEDDGADLSGIALTPGELCVSQAVQQAVLKVDEEGTVAAALTEIAVAEASLPVVTHSLHLDRPYLFTVSHTATGWPLFMAAVRDPRPAAP